MKVEYRVKERTVYYVTRFQSGEEGCGCESVGEYSRYDTAYDVAYALASAEHKRLGYPLDDERIIYPAPRVDGVAEV